MTTTARKTTEKTTEKNFVVIDFLDIDTKKIKFQDVKPLTNGSKLVPLRYKDGNTDKQLYVKYGSRTSPFGISTSADKKDEYKGKYPNGEKITGYLTSVSFNKDYKNDTYFKKASELDEFFMDACIKNSVSWGLGGSKTKTIDRTAIEGYDEQGLNGKWKRLVKYSYKTNKSTNEREYTDYAPRMEFGLPTQSMSETMGENGLMQQKAILKPGFYDADGEAMPVATTENMNELLPKFSKLSNLSSWGNLSLGTYGATLKPKIQQCRVYPNERLSTDECLLNDDDVDDEGELTPELGNIMGSASARPVATKSSEPPKISMADTDEVKEDDVVEGMEMDENASIEEEDTEPVKPPVRTTKVITTKSKVK